MSETEGLETRSEAEAAGGESQFWQLQLELAEKDHKDWIKQGRDVIDRYKSESKAGAENRDRRKKFNILYSNTEVMKAALFARMAKPDVRRRFSDQDPIGRQIAEIIERALIYCNDVGDSERSIEGGIEDYVLPGRGVVRVCYECELASSPAVEASDGVEAEPAKEYVAKQELYDEYVSWEHFRHEPAETWERVTWEAFRHLMTRDDLIKNFADNLGEDEAKKIPLNWQPSVDKKAKIPEAFKKAEVWEIWDKTLRQRVWIVNGYDKVCRKDKDPYGLEDFWPNPEPIQATTTNDTLIPQPEFLTYKDQADELDEIETRSDRLTKALKRRGVYNATITELKRLASASDNQFIPVEKWSEFQAGGGFKGAYDVEDIAPIIAVLVQLDERHATRVQAIYELVGIADIMRGSSNPNETLGAQQLKAQFGSNRLKRRQDRVQRWIRDLMRIKAEIIAEHFEPEKLSEITGFPWIPQPPVDPQTGQPAEAPERAITPEIVQILRTDRLRSYRIDVETDSTIYEDAEAEKASRTELITAMTQFIGNWAPIIQGNPTLMPLAFEMLAFAVRGFKTGRQLEEAIEQTRMQLETAAKQQQAQPAQPSPEDQAAQQDQQQAQADAQTEQHKNEIQAQADQHAAETKAMTDQHKAEMDAAKEQAKADLEKAKLDQTDRHHNDEMSVRNRELNLKSAAHNRQLVDETTQDLIEQPVNGDAVPASLKDVVGRLDIISQRLAGELETITGTSQGAA